MKNLFAMLCGLLLFSALGYGSDEKQTQFISWSYFTTGEKPAGEAEIRNDTSIIYLTLGSHHVEDEEAQAFFKKFKNIQQVIVTLHISGDYEDGTYVYLRENYLPGTQKTSGLAGCIR